MADNDAPIATRTRYSLRSSTRPKPNETNEQSEENVSKSRKRAYTLRSSGNIDAIDFMELPRKRRKLNMMSLNRDCWLKLFEYMQLTDLCAMAKTCTEMSYWAKYYFRLKHKHFDFVRMFYGNLLDMQVAFELLSTFGDQIHTLKISQDLFNIGDIIRASELLVWIADNCQKTLKALELDGFPSVSYVMQFNAVKMLFESIQSLVLEQCDLEDDTLWCNMNNLKVLKLKGCNTYGSPIWKSNFDQLEEAQFESCDMNMGELRSFISLAPSIKCLSIVKCREVSTAMFATIKNAIHLKEFEFQLNHPNSSEENYHRDVMQLTALTKLKVLKLNCNKWSVQRLIDDFAEKKIAIEHLELADGPVDGDTVRAIIKLKTIKVLKLNDMIEQDGEFTMFPITKELDQLEELHIKTASNKFTQYRLKETVRAGKRLTCLKIDAQDFDVHIDTYRAIITAVQKRIDKNFLALTLYGDSNQLQIPVPNEVLNEPNTKWITVKKLDRNANHLFPMYASIPQFLEEDEFDELFDFDDEDDIPFDEIADFLRHVPDTEAMVVDSDADTDHTPTMRIIVPPAFVSDSDDETEADRMVERPVLRVVVPAVVERPVMRARHIIHILDTDDDTEAE